MRAQIGRVRQTVHGQLEHRIAAQRVGILAVFIAGRDHQHAKAKDLVQAMQNPLRGARVTQTGGQALGQAKPLFDLAQRQQAAIGGQMRAVKARRDRSAEYR